MANYTIPENPQYTAEIRKLENTDPANAETILNPLVETLIGNTHAVKLEADKKANSGHTHSPGDCGLGKNLTFTGAVTGTYNGQAAKSVLIPDRKGCRFVVGTSTAGHTLKDCDYLCDGTADQVEINNAINALPSTGGEVVVLAGTYNITASITVNKSNVKLRGNGNATVLKRMWKATSASGVIYVKSSNCCVEGFYIDGNKTNYENSYNFGIYVDNNTNNNIITGNKCNNERNGIFTGSGNIITRNVCTNNIIYGISVGSNNVITENIYNNNNYGIYLYSSNNNVITENICNNNNYGIHLYTNNSNNAIIGNICNNNNYGIHITSNSTNNIVMGNTIYRESYTTSQYSIYIGTNCNNNLIADNMIWGKNYANSGTNNTFVNNKYN